MRAGVVSLLESGSQVWHRYCCRLVTGDFSASVRDQDAAEHGISIPVASIFRDSRLFLPFREWIITMLDERFTRRNNIARYRGLLKTNLTDLERQFIERRLSEEQSEFELLSAGTVAAKVQNGPARSTFRS